MRGLFPDIPVFKDMVELGTGRASDWVNDRPKDVPKAGNRKINQELINSLSALSQSMGNIVFSRWTEFVLVKLVYE